MLLIAHQFFQPTKPILIMKFSCALYCLIDIECILLLHTLFILFIIYIYVCVCVVGREED